MTDGIFQTYNVVITQADQEIARIEVVARDPGEALSEAKWLLAEETAVNLLDCKVSFHVEPVL